MSMQCVHAQCSRHFFGFLLIVHIADAALRYMVGSAT